MKSPIGVGVALAIGGILALTGCSAQPLEEKSSYSPEDASYGNSDEVDSGDDYWNYENSDLNSKVISGENGIETITVTLNNGDTIECVSYGELQCFPGTLTPAPPR